MSSRTMGYTSIDDRPLAIDPIDLVAIDLDGTLLSSDRSVGLRAAEAIARVSARGVKIVLASARPPRSTTSIYQALGLDTLQINHNGALIIDPVTDRVLFHKTIDESLAREATQVIRKMSPDIAIGVDVLDCVYIDSPRRRALVDPRVGLSGAEQTAIKEGFKAPVTKIFMIGEPDLLGGVQLQLQQQFGNQLTFAYSHMRLLQIMHGEVDKASALARVAKHYEVDRKRVMAIGDAPNDMPMIEWAGLGIAVTNGYDEVRKAANFIVPSNDDDGVADALEKYVL